MSSSAALKSGRRTACPPKPGDGGRRRFVRPIAFARPALLFALLAAPLALRAADHVSIAAAANLIYVLDPLDAAFTQTHPDLTLTSATGSSGSLVAQLRNGAPYDVFLSADLEYPQQLIKSGAADPASLTTFAIGRLVLWTTRADLAPSSVAAVVHDPAVHKLAIANPAGAPYGRAAQQALANLGLTIEAQPKLVFGENISQAFQFVETGNADAGFVALSLVLSPKLKDKGRYLEIPPNLYAPLAQGAVLTTRGAANPAARAYLHFLRTPPAQAILRQFGYAPP